MNRPTGKQTGTKTGAKIGAKTPPGLAVRRAVLKALSRVFAEKIYLESALEIDGFEASDVGFAKRLALSVLRHKGRLDGTIGPFLQKPPKPVFGHILRMAAAEMILLDTRPHAAVDMAVRLAKSEPGGHRVAGMVNAVCRRLSEEGAARFDALSPLRDMPRWLEERLQRAYGKGAAMRIAAAHTKGAPLDLTPKEDPECWAEVLGAQLLPGGSLRLTRTGRITELAGFEEGAWWVQDYAASLPVRLLEEVRGKRILDLCAAPGGKTLQLAAAGAEVTAVDISAARVKRLYENLTRTGLQAEVVIADAFSLKGTYDGVLLDASCSATGTIRRHPELPHIRNDKALGPLLELQARLLDHAWELMRPGGRLVYATCSLLPEEGERQLSAMLERASDAHLAPLPDAYTEFQARGGGLRTLPLHWPEWGGMDGFFAAALLKRH